MKLQLNRQELAEALSAVGAVAATRTPKPILQCVLVEAHPDHCVLAATDLEIGIRFSVTHVEVETPGRTVLPADKFSHIVRESADDVIQLELEQTVCHLRGTNAHFQIYTHDPADFPPVAELPGEPDFEVQAGMLRRMADWTVFAAARENTRYAINGVLWEKDKKALSLVATDGRRLSLATGTISSGNGPNMESIVPVKAMTVFQRILTEAEATIAVKLTGNQIVVRSPRATVSTGLVEGRFPNYRDVIPQDCDRSVSLRTVEFLSAVKQAALLTNEESKGVRLSFREGTLILSSRAPSEGEATIQLPIEYHKSELDIGFNPHFLIEALKNVPLDEVTFEFKHANLPGLLRAAPDLLYVVMPVNLS